MLEVESSDAVSPKPNPVRWWQWIVMYPALFIAVCSNIPRLPEAAMAIQKGMSLEAAAEALEQNHLWQKNLSCLSQQREVAKNQNSDYLIGVTICPTGDMLVRVEDSNPQDAMVVAPVYRWIALAKTSTLHISGLKFDKLAVNRALSSLIPAAMAIAPASTQPVSGSTAAVHISQSATVLCQKLLEDGRLLRRLQYSDGRCVDEVINTFTGEVVSQTAGTCSAGC